MPQPAPLAACGKADKVAPMTEFLTNATSFPTAIFSVLLLVCLAFWVLALIGLLGIDALDFDFDVDADLDASIDLNTHHALDAPQGGADGADGGADGAAGSASVIAAWLMKFGLHGIPITVVVTALVLLSWFFCYFASAYLLVLIPAGLLQTVAGFALAGVCFYVSMPVAGAALGPMRPLLKGDTALEMDDLLGRTCVVRSLEVNESFGQGYVDDGGAGLLLDIRADSPNRLAKGDEVALIRYHKQANTFDVMDHDEFMKL